MYMGIWGRNNAFVDLQSTSKAIFHFNSCPGISFESRQKFIPVSIIRSILAHAVRMTTITNVVANAFDTTAAAFVLTIPYFGAARNPNTIPNTRISKMKTEGSHIMVPA